MRRDVSNWWLQALEDFENAKDCLKLEKFYLVAFLVQQAVEKGLKAYYILKKEDFPDKTHSLIYLGKELDVPNNLMSNLRKINPDFIYTRYPDLDGVPPYLAYDKVIASERVLMGDEIIKWLKSMIEK
ncbi:MAG: HEPN domain-containing protein [Candidatus Woesearchaeota archaeon]